MKSVYINSYGSFDNVVIGEVEKPEVGKQDVLVKMKAASVNPIDWKLVHGDLKAMIRLKFPILLGNDGSGIIESVGSEVSDFKIGDEVFFRSSKAKTGTFAEYFAISSQYVAKKPKNMSFEEAASIPLVGLTVYQSLLEKANMSAGDKVLIHAGAGGVGSFAIQFAKAYGAYVATTASKKRFELLKKLGADKIIDYHNEKIENELHDYDIVLDTLGDSVQESSYKILKSGGILVSILGIPDPETVREFTSNPIVILVSRFYNWNKKRKASKYKAVYKQHLMYSDGKQLSEIAGLIERGKIKAVIDSTYPLDKVKEAFEKSSTGRSEGKIIISINI